ncbi:MAG: sigma-70 family RNA polymerase sigma factor [Kiritimatiellae bacterium]|nr:sigma-70 family RNA polymerase sigma factor [Kiritimatiellia bacterium]
MNEFDETAVVQAVRAGDLDAFESLMAQYAGRLRALIALKAPVAHLIDEIAHEAFVYAYRHIEAFTPGTSFFAWLAAIAHQLLRAQVQRYSRDLAHQLDYREEAVLAVCRERLSEKRVRELDHLEACLGRVPAKLRAVLDMKYKMSFSAEEIASATRRTIAWVRTTLCRVRKELRTCIEARLAAERG